VRLEGLALDAMVKLGDLELQAGSCEQAIAAANRAISINNLREDAQPGDQGIGGGRSPSRRTKA
jgi:hypothetical protein